MHACSSESKFFLFFILMTLILLMLTFFSSISLAMKKSDVELEAGLTQVMGVYGTVHVIMNRDESKGNMPHAWCQFTKKEHAEKALAGAAGAMVHGRPLRIERAKANRK